MATSFIPEKVKKTCLSAKGLLALFTVNLVGTFFGFYYYIPQFSETAPVLWLLVADSPIATFLIALSFLLYRYEKQNSLIDFLAFIGNIKYGLWTVFVLIYYFETFWTANSTPMYLFLLFSHLGMFLQAFLVLDYSKFSFKAVIAGGAWFIINDISDYLLDTHTRVFAEHSHPLSAIMVVAVFLTLTGIILGYQNRFS